MINNWLKFLAVILLLHSCHVKKDNVKKEFEGYILFSDTLIAKRSDLIDGRKLNKIRGNKHWYYYKDGSYKIITNGKPKSTTIYRKGDSLFYTFKEGTDTLFTQSILKEKRDLDTLYFSGKKDKHLGRNTYQIIKKIKNTKYTYWVDSSLYVNPKKFKDYKFGFLNQFYSKSHGVFLKERYESPIFIIQSSSLKIDSTSLEDSFFNIPEYPKVKLIKP